MGPNNDNGQPIADIIDQSVGVNLSEPNSVFSDQLEPKVDSLDNTRTTKSTYRQPAKTWLRMAGIGFFGLAILIGVPLVIRSIDVSKQQTNTALGSTNTSMRLKIQSIPLSSVGQKLSATSSQQINTLTVNGQVSVAGSLQLQPISTPASPAAGQLYYNQSTNQLGYYDGEGFVYLNGGGPSANNYATYITNITNQPATTYVTNISDGGITATNGTTGDLALFSGPDTLGDSAISQSGSTLNVATTGSNTVVIGSASGTTNINGGGAGINLNETLGDINLTSSYGAINETADSAAYTTTSGALDIASATTTTWGVATAATGAGGNLTMQAGSASDGASDGGDLILQSGSATGTGVSGNVSINTGSDIGTTGTITVASGNSSSTASGDVTVDTGVGFVSGTVISDDTFEDNTTDNFESWYGDTLSATNTEAHTGSYSIEMTATNTEWGVIANENQPAAAVPVTAGHRMFFSLWVRAATTPRTIEGTVVWYGNGATAFTPVTDNTTGWTEMSLSATVPAGVTKAYFEFSGLAAVGEVHYFDDIEATDLSSSSSTSSLNLGETNAQIVNIGNMNELGTTTIDGGSGITLDSGSAPLTATAGSISFDGSAASSLGTTFGSLTLGSGGGTDGGVYVVSQADSTTAFEVQSSLGSPLLTVDTTDEIVDISTLAVTNSITVDGHIISSGGPPTIAPGTAACTSPTVSVSGDDIAGTITVTTGSGCSSSGDLANLTFSNVYGATPHITLTPGSANALTLGTYINDGTAATTGFSIGTNSAPANATTYLWNYQVIQ